MTIRAMNIILLILITGPLWSFGQKEVETKDPGVTENTLKTSYEREMTIYAWILPGYNSRAVQNFAEAYLGSPGDVLYSRKGEDYSWEINSDYRVLGTVKKEYRSESILLSQRIALAGKKPDLGARGEEIKVYVAFDEVKDEAFNLLSLGIRKAVLEKASGSRGTFYFIGMDLEDKGVTLHWITSSP